MRASRSPKHGKGARDDATCVNAFRTAGNRPLAEAVCGVSAANCAARSRTKRLLSPRGASYHCARASESSDSTRRSSKTRRCTGRTGQRSVPFRRAGPLWRAKNRRSGDHTSIRIHRSAPSTHTAMLAVALLTAAAINNVRPLLDPLSLIGDAKATQRCGLRTYQPLAPNLEMATLAMS